MKLNYLQKKPRYKKYHVLMYQKQLIEKNYTNWRCTINNKVLKCIGTLQLEGCSSIFKVKLEYVAGFEPKTTILTPIITPSKEIHMYEDHSLCLHYNHDMPWNEKVQIHLTTIPWISEWIVFYEIFKITNEWEGKESPVHLKEADKNINRDTDFRPL